MWSAAATVLLPGRGQDLVGAAGAGGRIDGAEVAARLAHHDRLRDRPVPEPAGNGLLCLCRRDLLRLLHLLLPGRHLGPEAGERRRLLGASLLEPRRLSLGGGANAGDHFAGGSDPLIEGDRLGASAFHLGELRRDQVAELAHPRGERRIGALDPAEKLGAIDKVIEAVRVQQQLGGVRRVALVDRHETGRERPQGPAQAGSSPGELRRGLLDSDLELGLALLALRQHGWRARPLAPRRRPPRNGPRQAAKRWRRSRRRGSAPAIRPRRSWSSARRRSGRRSGRRAEQSPQAPRPRPARARQRGGNAPGRARVRLLSGAYGPSFTACGVS